MALQTTFNLVDAYLIARLPAGEVGAAVGAIGICDQVSALGTIVSYRRVDGGGGHPLAAQGRGGPEGHPAAPRGSR